MRLQRTGLIGMSAFGLFYGVIQAAAYNAAAGTTQAAHVLFGQQMTTLGQSFTYLLPLPVRLDTYGGYLTWRVYGGLPLLFLFWAILAAAGATRGDEDRGLIEQWLTRGASRTGYLAVRFVSFAIAAAVAVALSSAGIYASSVLAGNSLHVAAVVEMAAALLAVTFVSYAIVLVAAQFVTTRNSAAGVGGGLLFALVMLNGFGRTVEGLRPLARIVSPFYYYDRTNPLVPGGSFDAVGTVGLLVVAVAIAGLAIWLMNLRDLGSPLLTRRAADVPETVKPSPNPMLRFPVLAAVYEQRVGLAAWSIGTGVFAALMASIGHTMTTLLTSPGPFHAYLTSLGHGDPYVAIAGLFWFGVLDLLLALFAITEVSRWTADDREGRLEMELTAPVSRLWIVVERLLGLLAATAIVVAISSVAFYISGHLTNTNIPAGDLAVASLVMLPYALTFGAVGALLASRIPRATIGILVTVAFASYLITQGGPLFKLPDSVLNLSVFSLVGSPMTNGVYWTGLWTMIAITAVGFALATVVMQRREVGS